MTDRVFRSQLFVPRELDEVFGFFATPRNLETITPPWLRFRILHQTDAEVREGTEFIYGLSLRGLPVRWCSRIIDWSPGESFTDIQIRGPYAKWHHTHTFRALEGGTLVVDEVRYRLPMGQLGRLIAGRFVDSDVRKIFEYRTMRIQELLGGEPIREERPA